VSSLNGDRRRIVGALWRGVATLVLAGLGGCLGQVACTGGRHVAVLLYGDSLADEGQHWFEASFPSSVKVEVHVLGGTAICDFLPQLRGDVARARPAAVVFEFAGNAVTRCTQPAPAVAATRQQLDERYRADAATATRLATAIGGEAWWMGAPVNRDPGAEIGNGDIRAIYQGLARQYPRTHYVDAGAAVERDGQFTATLPCLPEEPCARVDGNENVVRADDGGHLCPSHQLFTDTCSVWSSGAYRFGRAMALPVLASLQLPPARVAMP